MSERTLLITGAAGQLGKAVAVASAGEWRILAPGLDITDPAAVRAALAALRPKAVVNCAAMTDTALCEQEPEQAEAVNARGPAELAAACAASGSYLVHISTNEVFAGTASEPYTETAPTGPLNAYARSKRRGEELLLSLNPAAVVVRTAWLYGDGRRNFVRRVLGWAAARPELAVVTDEVATPTACASLALVLGRLLEERPAGILHATDAGLCSRFEWATEILRLTGADPRRVRPALLVDFPEAAPKPRYSVLNTARLRGLGVEPPDWREAFSAFISSEAGRSLRNG